MLCRLASGGLLQVRLDMISDRPHATTNYEFQGTDGVYESGRGGPGEQAKVWLRALDGSPHWRPLAEAYAMVARGGHETNMPELETVPDGVGHGGGDFFVLRDFVDALKSGRSPATDIHRALDMTLPGLVSQESIRENSSWLPVPDSRDWVEVDSRSGLH
jgi:hypothetical protein